MLIKTEILAFCEASAYKTVTFELQSDSFDAEQISFLYMASDNKVRGG